MKKVIITLVLAIWTIGLAFSQQDSLSVLVTTDLEKECWSFADVVINNYADSLNFAKRPENLPKYLNNYLFDWDRSNWPSPCISRIAEKISYRKAILDRVIREDVLGWIAEATNKNYDKLYDPKKQRDVLSSKERDYLVFPNLSKMENSWRDLAKARLEEVRKLKNSFGN